MPVPDFQSLMLPVLKLAAKGEIRISDAVERLADELNLSDEDRAELLPSGRQSTFANRVHWAKTYLKQAGLVDSSKRAYFTITPRGRQILEVEPPAIDIRFLKQFPEFQAFRERSTEPLESETNSVVPSDDQFVQTPDDRIRSAAELIHETLGREIIDRILAASPGFFERTIVTLLLAMGYGGTAKEAGRAIGRTGDDGVDGVIDQDTLGLDRVYVQAKRYQRDNTVGPAAIRDFFGSLDMHKATKGLFVTTSSFSRSAQETAERLGKRIVLIDGNYLADLMIRFSVGCRREEVIEIKRIDEEFFE